MLTEKPAAPALFALLARLRRATGLAAPPPAAPGSARSLVEAVSAVRDWHREAEQRAMRQRVDALPAPAGGAPAPVTLPRHAFEALLREREAAVALRALFDDGSVLLLAFETRAPFCVREASPALRRMLGAAPAPVGQPLATLFAADSARRLLQALAAGGADDDTMTLELQLAGAQGSCGWWQLQAGPADATGMRQARLLDLQPLRRAQAEAAAQQRLARRGAARLERGQRLREQQLLLARRLPGCADDESLAQCIADAALAAFPGWHGALWLAEDDEAPLRRVAAWPDQVVGVDEVPAQMLCVPLAAGSPEEPHGALHLQCDTPPPADERAAWRADAQAFAQSLQQQLALRALRRAMQERSLRDALTDLPGPREFEEALARETARLRRSDGRAGLALARVELEDAQALRTTCGNGAADEALRRLAQSLRGFARQEDTVCRVGPAVFALLLPGAPPASAQARLAQLRARLAQRAGAADPAALARPGVAIGVVEVDREDHDPQALLERAAGAARAPTWLRAVA